MWATQHGPDLGLSHPQPAYRSRPVISPCWLACTFRLMREEYAQSELDDGMARFLGKCACTSQFECVDCPSRFGDISVANLGNMRWSSDHVFGDVGCSPEYGMGHWRLGKGLTILGEPREEAVHCEKWSRRFIKGGCVMLAVDSRVKKLKPKCESQSCFFLKAIIFFLLEVWFWETLESASPDPADLTAPTAKQLLYRSEVKQLRE